MRHVLSIPNVPLLERLWDDPKMARLTGYGLVALTAGASAVFWISLGLAAARWVGG